RRYLFTFGSAVRRTASLLRKMLDDFDPQVVHGFYLVIQIIAVVDIFLFIGIFILFQWPLMASQVKRWHDIGKSGWNCLIWFVPFVGLIMTLFEAGLSKGHLLRNQYGSSLYRVE
uniref:DUF805 domain-containing protein n=1 Tax=uncultured Pseudoalteromonas sp. TaxID=114053 RepID=UPI00261C09FD